MESMAKQQILTSTGAIGDVAVASTGTIYTQSVKIKYGHSFCLSIRAKSSTGTPDLDVYHEQTHVDGAAEGVAGDTTSGWAAPDGAAKLIDVTDESWHHLTLSPLVLPYVRLKIVGQGSNPADCTVEAYLTQLEIID